MDETAPNPSITLQEWENELLKAALAVESSRYRLDDPLPAFINLMDVIARFPPGPPPTTTQSMKLVDCLEYAQRFTPKDDRETNIRRKVVYSIFELLDPWRQDDDGYRLKRRPLIVGLAIQSNDPKIFAALLRLPGAPSLDQMLERGWMHVDPEKSTVSMMGMRPPALPANTGPIPASVRWLALMASRATQISTGLPGYFSVAEKLLINKQGVVEPFLGERHLLEFALGPHVVEELVKRGADPSALTQAGISRVESAIRRPEATPQSIRSLARLAARGEALQHLPSKIRAEMAEAVVEVFIERFPSQGLSWPEEVAQLCGDVAKTRVRSGARMVDMIAHKLACARQIDDNPLLVLEQLGVDPATAGDGFIGKVPAWVVWEWLVVRYPAGGGVDDPSRGMFCQAAGLEWTPARMLELVGSGLVDMPNQTRLIHQAIEYDPMASLLAACAFFERLGCIPNPGINLEFDAGIMLDGISKCPELARASPEVAGTLAPWLAMFGKPLPTVGNMDQACVLHNCERILAIHAKCESQGEFLGKPHHTLEQVEILRSAALMALHTPTQAPPQDSASVKRRF